jgi:hypothetical protein
MEVRMSDFQAPVKLIAWVLGMVLTLGLLGSLGPMTYKMGVKALEAHEKDQISYGRFSRKLWSTSK